MKNLKNLLTEGEADGAYCLNVYTDTVARAVREHDDTLGMLTAFRHSANSLAIEAGIIVSHVPHDEAGKSVIGDIYFLQLLAETELRMRTLSTGYEKLRAAVIPVLDDYREAIACVDPEHDGEMDESRILADELREALDNDLSQPLNVEEWSNCPCGGGMEQCPNPETGKPLCTDSKP